MVPRIRPNSAARGLSLMELVFSMGLTVVAVSVIVSVLWMFYRQIYDLDERVKMEEEILEASFQLQQLIGLAVNVQPAVGALEGVDLAGGPGRIRQLTVNTLGNASGVPGGPGSTTTMAIFLRETGGRGGDLNSFIRRTGIFYQRPIGFPNSRSGVVYIDTGSSANLRPQFSDVFFGRVTEFGISNFELAGATGNVLTALQVSITMRAFTGHQATWNWCPQTDITNATPGCTGLTAQYRDYTRTFRVVLRNQIIGNTPRNAAGTVDGTPVASGGVLLHERTLGNIYFYPFYIRN